MNQPNNNSDVHPCGDMSEGHCREALERLDDYLDRDLTPHETSALEAHLQLCDHCTEEYGLRSAAQDVLRCKLLGEKCPDALRAFISARLHADSR
jgi:anti-sigma factor (TIGR02949 family)